MSFIDSTTTDVLFYDQLLCGELKIIKQKKVLFEIVNMSAEEYFKECCKIRNSTESDFLSLISEETINELERFIDDGNQLPLPFIDLSFLS